MCSSDLGGGGQELGIRGVGNFCLIVMELQLHKRKRVTGLDGATGSTTVWMYSVPLNCTLKNG